MAFSNEIKYDLSFEYFFDNNPSIGTSINSGSAKNASLSAKESFFASTIRCRLSGDR